MSFDTTPKKGLFVTGMTADTWTLKEAIPERTEVGPDNLRLVYDGFFPNALTAASPSLSAYTRGAIPADVSGTWRICSATPSRLYGPFWRLEVTAKGMISTQAKKIRWITGSSSFSAENIDVPGYGIVPNLSSRIPEVGMELSYLTFAATPSVPSVGVSATPPNPRPPTPANPWTSIAAPVIHYPNGWVREAVDNDEIVPGLWWTTERYNYVFAVTG